MGQKYKKSEEGKNFHPKQQQKGRKGATKNFHLLIN